MTIHRSRLSNERAKHSIRQLTQWIVGVIYPERLSTTIERIDARKGLSQQTTKTLETLKRMTDDTAAILFYLIFYLAN